MPDGSGRSAHGGTAEQEEQQEEEEEEEEEEGALPHCSAACRAAHGARHRAELPLLEPALLLLCGLDESVLPLSRLLLVLRLLLQMGDDGDDSVAAFGDDDAGAGATGLGGLSDHLAEATALSQGGGDGDGDGDGSSAASNQYLAQARLASAGLAAMLLSSSAGPLSAGGGGGGAAAAAAEHVEREALRLLMVARVNGFELGQQQGANGGGGSELGGSGGCALFARIAALNHDCGAPSCRARWDWREAVLEVRTTRAVAPGEELTLSYLGGAAAEEEEEHGVAAGMQTAGERRRAFLRSTKYFDCACALCCQEKQQGGQSNHPSSAASFAAEGAVVALAVHII